MSDMWSNCFSFISVTSRKKIFQNCKKFLYPILLSSWLQCKQTLKLSPCYLIYYLSIITADQNMSFHEKVGRIIGQISIQLAKQSTVCQSSNRSDDVCYVWGLPHVYEDSMFTLHKNGYTCFKVSSQVHRPQQYF